MTNIRAATFNIQHGINGEGLKTDAQASARLAASLQPDLLSIQEVDIRVFRSRFVDQLSVFEESTGMEVFFGQAKRVALVGQYGIALLVRGSILDAETIDLPKFGDTEQRVAIVASVAIADVIISVATTHLSVNHLEALDQLMTVTEALGARPAPRVLLGDLNLRPGHLDDVLKPLGYSIAGGGPTYPSVDPKIRIDHIATSGLRIQNVEIPQATESDHRPLVAVLQG